MILLVRELGHSAIDPHELSVCVRYYTFMASCIYLYLLCVDIFERILMGGNNTS